MEGRSADFEIFTSFRQNMTSSGLPGNVNYIFVFVDRKLHWSHLVSVLIRFRTNIWVKFPASPCYCYLFSEICQNFNQSLRLWHTSPSLLPSYASETTKDHIKILPSQVFPSAFNLHPGLQAQSKDP